ncbi:hypothetical protein CBER1_08411 [Cercospora berteroae]|uniref:DUF2231 domain-containing protein n=1 Tax=Cercospora berteroae TaxID=357750 RepID=A0A2S6BV60_9PEZI|nr:hypothetical protein CBER1_08411 [Cercospora berteroae]
MGKPVHPAVVHFPIAFLFTAYALDILHTYRTSLPAFAQNALLGPNDITRSSYYLLSLGLLTAIPAVVTGGRELIMMISKQGMHEADGKTVRTKVKATIAHAVANDIVIAVSTYIWYSRRAQVNDTIAGKIPGTAAAAYAPSSAFVFAEFLTLGLLLMGANIGGTLTYNYGVGFSSLSAGKKEAPNLSADHMGRLPVNLRSGTYADDDKKRIEKAHAVHKSKIANGVQGEKGAALTGQALAGQGSPLTG